MYYYECILNVYSYIGPLSEYPIRGIDVDRYTVKSDTLKLIDISMSNCTSSWQLLGLMRKSDFSHYFK